MKLHVLGCSGGSAPGHQPTSFLIDDCVAVDGGAITTVLCEEGQEKIDHVLISHCHLDHVATLPFLLDNRFARQRRPIRFYGSESTLDDLKTGLFNNRIWPDFTQLKNRKSVALELQIVHEHQPFPVAHLKVTAHSMVHPIPCFGFLIEDANASIFIAGDTSDPASIREFCADRPTLKAIVLEVSWPDRMEELGRLAGHIVPKFLAPTLPLHPTAELLVSHVKPFYRDEVLAELRALRAPMRILEDGDVLEFA